MYSYEDRVRAVRLHIKLDKRVWATIRQLGYPTDNSLKSWHLEYERLLDLPAGYVRPPRYSQAQKELAVEHYLEHGRCLAATIEALGYPGRESRSAWVQERHPATRTRVVGTSQVLTPASRDRVVLPKRLAVHVHRAVRRDTGLLHPLVQREADQDLIGRLQPHRAPTKPWARCLTSPRFLPHPGGHI